METKILIADDDSSLREYIQKALQQSGFTVETAFDACSAIEKMKNDHYTIIITDKNMPGTENREEGGMDVLRYVRRHCPLASVIMITGFSSYDTAIEAMRLGAFDYLLKPFGKEEIVNKIARIIEYQQFLNPDSVMILYKELLDEFLNFMQENAPAANEELKHKLTKSFSGKLDHLFRTLRNWEDVIIEQRDALTNIAGFAEQLQEITTPENPGFELVEKICRETSRRL